MGMELPSPGRTLTETWGAYCSRHPPGTQEYFHRVNRKHFLSHFKSLFLIWNADFIEEKEIDIQFGSPLTKQPQWLEVSWFESGAWNLLWVSHVGTEPKDWGNLCCFPCTSAGSWTEWGAAGTHMGCWHTAGGRLTYYATVPAPKTFHHYCF